MAFNVFFVKNGTKLNSFMFLCFFHFLPFLEDSSHDLLEELFSLLSNSVHNQLFLSNIDQIIHSTGNAPSIEDEAAYWIHEELCLRSLPSILVCPAQIVLQKVNDIFVTQEAFSYDIPLQESLD